jgi:hypothetical protein
MDGIKKPLVTTGGLGRFHASATGFASALRGLMLHRLVMKDEKGTL